LAIGDLPLSPFPNPQSPIPNPHYFIIMFNYIYHFNNKKTNKNKKIKNE